MGQGFRPISRPYQCRQGSRGVKFRFFFFFLKVFWRKFFPSLFRVVSLGSFTRNNSRGLFGSMLYPISTASRALARSLQQLLRYLTLCRQCHVSRLVRSKPLKTPRTDRQTENQRFLLRTTNTNVGSRGCRDSFSRECCFRISLKEHLRKKSPTRWTLWSKKCEFSIFSLPTTATIVIRAGHGERTGS